MPPLVRFDSAMLALAAAAVRTIDSNFMYPKAGTQKKASGATPRRNDPERLTLLADQPSDREDRQHSAIQMDVARAHDNVVWHNLTRSKDKALHTIPLQNDSAQCYRHWALSYLQPSKEGPIHGFRHESFPWPPVGMDERIGTQPILASCCGELCGTDLGREVL